VKGPEPRSKAVDVVHDRGTPTPEANVNRRAAAVRIQRCFMTERLQQFIASMMNRVRMNRIQRQTCNVAAVFVKTRRFGGGLVVWFGNWFLYLAGSGICMFVRSRDWMKWEAYCAMLLYPDRPAVKFSSGNAVVVPEIRGVSIRQMLKAGDINLRAFIAAAREFRRVHGIPCSDYKAALACSGFATRSWRQVESGSTAAWKKSFTVIASSQCQGPRLQEPQCLTETSESCVLTILEFGRRLVIVVSILFWRDIFTVVNS